jgi:methyl-accepting chemotaxis protein
MGELSARKLSVISVDPDAKSKKLDETLEKLSAIRKEHEGSKAPMPSISAKRMEASEVAVEKTAQVEEQENIVQEKAAAPQHKIGSSLKSLRVTSDVKKEEAPKAKVHEAPKTAEKPKTEQKNVPKKKPALNEMFEGDAENEPVLMLSPRNGAPKIRSVKYKIVSAIGFLATAGWLGLSGLYIHNNMGFAELFAQQPHILGGFLAGILAPIALLWMILAHIQRGSDINMYADALRDELQAMIFPSEERKQIIHKDIEALCAQAAELSTSSQTILNSIHRARVGLRNEIRDFSGLSKKTEFHIDRLADGLSERSKRLIELTDEIETRTTSLDAKTLSGAKAWDDAALSILSRAEEIEGALKKGALQIVSAANEADTMTKNINEKFSTSFETLKASVQSVKDMTGGTVEAIEQASKTIEDNRDALGEGAKLLADKADEITDTLNGSVSSMQDSIETLIGKSEGIDARLNERVSALGGVLSQMDLKIKDIETKGSEASDKLSAAMVSAISGADNIGSAVRRAIETLSKATEESKEQAEILMVKANEKVSSLHNLGEETSKKIENTLGLVDESRSKMEESSSVMSAQVEKLSAAVKSQAEEIERVQENLSERVESIQLSMNAPLEAMSRAVEKASEKHEEIEQTLAKRISDLNLASDKALENGNSIRDALRVQAQEISTLSGQLAGHSKSVESMMRGQSESLSENVNGSIERLEAVAQSMREQAEKLSSMTQSTEERIASLKESLSGNCSDIHTDTTRVVDDLRALDDVVSQKVKDLVEKSGEAGRSVEEMTSTFVSSADIIDPVYKNAIEKIDATKERFDKMSAGFEQNTESNLDKLKSMGILFDERLQTLTSSAQDASQILDQSSENLSSKVNHIESATKSASDRLHDMEQMFKNQASNIHLTTDQALIKIEAIQKALNDQFLDLSSTVGESVAQIENVGAQYAKRAEQIKLTSDEALERFDVAGHSADTQAKKLKALAQESTDQMKEIVLTVQREANALMETSAKTFAEMKKTSDGFAHRAKEVEAQMKQSLKTSQEYNEGFDRQSEKMAESTHKNADQIAQAVAKLAGKMLEVNKAADMVSEKIEGSRNKLSTETDQLADVSIKAARVVEESAQNYLRQSNALFKATEEAKTQAEKIRTSDARTQRESFLNSTKFILESLHSLSVDLTRMVDGDIKERTWKSYQNGDIAAFTKYLIGMKDKFPMAKMQDKYASDNEFRTYVNRFIRQFEDVYEQAIHNDHSDLLANVFASSTIGDLYLVLCEVAGKKTALKKAA